jgi:Ca2+-binding EF-hand superfamily protein
MATKPLSQLSPAYRKRIEAALAKGKSRQAARGHKVKEHVIRKQKSIEATGLTPSQRDAIRKFSVTQAKRGGTDTITTFEDLMRFTNRDYSRFSEIKTLQRKFQKSGKGTIGRARFDSEIEKILRTKDKSNEYWFYYN